MTEILLCALFRLGEFDVDAAEEEAELEGGPSVGAAARHTDGADFGPDEEEEGEGVVSYF